MLLAYQPNFTPNQQHILVQPHDSQQQRLLQFQNRIIQQQQQHLGQNEMSELEILKARQQQQQQQANSVPNGNYKNGTKIKQNKSFRIRKS